MTESGPEPARAGPANDRGALRGICDFVACVEALLLDAAIELEAAVAQVAVTRPDPPKPPPRAARAGAIDRATRRRARVVRRRPGR